MQNIIIPQDLVIQSVQQFHPDDQINQMLEELGELIVATNHFRRGRIDTKPLVEEMADCILTISQALATIANIQHNDPLALDMLLQNMLLIKAEKLRRKIVTQTQDTSTIHTDSACL